jgi:hypothetical protein
MARNSERNHTRESIAYLAARIMAQDGIEDYAQAKRKAARQSGVTQRQWPSNDEIAVALKQYRSLYQPGHPWRLRELRQLALEVMDQFSEFNPQLTGSVLNGNAGDYATVHIQIFTDNGKSVEHDLINRGVAFSRDELRLYAGAESFAAPVIIFEFNSVEIRMTLLSMNNQRTHLKTSPEGKPFERAGRAAVASLIDAG